MAFLKKHKEILLYLVFGALTTAVSWGTYMVFMRVIPWAEPTGSFFQWLDRYMELDIFWAKLLSWICAVLFAFITNKIWVFCSKSWRPGTFFRELISFIASRGVTGIIEIFGTPFLVELGLNQTLFGTKGMVANIVISVAVVILNYLFSKLLVFTKKKEPVPSETEEPESGSGPDEDGK